MDFLLKYNVTKKSRLIIDVGRRYIKLMSVDYAGGEARITETYKTDAYSAYNMEGWLILSALAKIVNEIVNVKKAVPKADIRLSLPSDAVKYKVGAAKNIKPTELDKYVRDNLGLQRVSTETHNIDKTYLGKKELNGDTLLYYMGGAAEKSFAAEVVFAFGKYDLHISGLSFSMADMTLLAGLLETDAEPNKVYIDFGAAATNIAVESVGTVIYCREIDIGFFSFTKRISDATGISRAEVADLILEGQEPDNEDILETWREVYTECVEDWQQEVARILNMMDDDGVLVTRAVLLNPLLPQMDERMRLAEIKIESIWDAVTDGSMIEKHKVRFLKSIKDMDGFGCCLGAAVAPYLPSLNLLSQSDKDAEGMRIVKKAGKITAIALVILSVISVGNAVIQTLLLQKTEKDYDKYNTAANEIKYYTEEKTKGETFLAEYNKTPFPLMELLTVLEAYRPVDVAIISIDNTEILADQTADEENNNGEEESDENGEETEAQTDNTAVMEYDGDLSGKTLTLRGLATAPDAATKYVKSLMTCEYVSEAELLGMEEKALAGDNVNIFEVNLTLK